MLGLARATPPFYYLHRHLQNPFPKMISRVERVETCRSSTRSTRSTWLNRIFIIVSSTCPQKASGGEEKAQERGGTKPQKQCGEIGNAAPTRGGVQC